LGLWWEELRRGGGISRNRAGQGEAVTRLGSGSAVEGMDLTCGARASVAGKREDGLAEDATQNRKRIPRSAPRALGPTMLSEFVASYGERAGRHGELGRLGRTSGKIQIRV
jgi:hypothetical protein